MYRNVLVPVDLSDKHSWRKALPTAVSLCETFEGKLHLITVVTRPQASTIGGGRWCRWERAPVLNRGARNQARRQCVEAV